MDASSFPVTLRDLHLKQAKVNEELGDLPWDLTDGKIGLIKVMPGWMGTVEVIATNISLNLQFNAMKAARAAGNAAVPPAAGPPAPPQVVTEYHVVEEKAAAKAPTPVVPPRFCQKHSSSNMRPKGDVRKAACPSCGMEFQTTYTQVVSCTNCSDREQKCMICGASAPSAGSYVPAQSAQVSHQTRPPISEAGSFPPWAVGAPGPYGYGGMPPSASPPGGMTFDMRHPAGLQPSQTGGPIQPSFHTQPGIQPPQTGPIQPSFHTQPPVPYQAGGGSTRGMPPPAPQQSNQAKKGGAPPKAAAPKAAAAPAGQDPWSTLQGLFQTNFGDWAK